jgi:hypothetical protein
MGIDETFDLGVVFVHGIGTQSSGVSLAEAAQELQRWFQSWFDGAIQCWIALGVHAGDVDGWQRELYEQRRREGAGEDKLHAITNLVERLQRCVPKGSGQTPLAKVGAAAGLTVVGGRATLLDGRFDPQSEEPPSVVLRMEVLLVDGSVCRTRWLLTEAWWAQSFPPPRFATLAVWALRFVPWLVATHLRQYVLRQHQRRQRVAEAAGWPWWDLRRAAGMVSQTVDDAAVLGGMILAPLAQLALLTLIAAALLPVPAIRRLVVRVQQSLAASTGDSYIFVTQPAWAAAMTGDVQRAYRWMHERAAATAVVGHSQGAAVAHEALADDRNLWPALMVTYGSGLRKLQGLRQLAAGRERRSWWVSWAVSLGAMLMGGGVVLAYSSTFRTLGTIVGAVGLYVTSQALFSPLWLAPKEVPNPREAVAERISEALKALEPRPPELSHIPLSAPDLIEITPPTPPIPLPGLGLKTFDRRLQESPRLGKPPAGASLSSNCLSNTSMWRKPRRKRR